MDVALIPPVPELRLTESTRTHLVLSHLFDQEEYLKYYRGCSEVGDFIILDNGAHENGVGESNASLLDKARLINADEIVLPDVLFNGQSTVELTKQMLKWIAGPGWNDYLMAGKPNFMIVPQGSNRTEWSKCLAQLMREWDLWTDRCPETLGQPCIGVSKDYEIWNHGLVQLIQRYIVPFYEERFIDVHCLGWPNKLWSLSDIVKEYPWVRSTDSAKPHVYAYYEIQLEPGGPIPDYPRRPPNYFNRPFTTLQRSIAKKNIEVFKAAATNMIISNEE